MASKAIICDISLRRMQDNGLPPTQISNAYSPINQELRRAGFDERIQKLACRTTDRDATHPPGSGWDFELLNQGLAIAIGAVLGPYPQATEGLHLATSGIDAISKALG